ncbi:MAG: hypothetical protein QM725_10285 [Lacibacter sp.]
MKSKIFLLVSIAIIIAGCKKKDSGQQNAHPENYSTYSTNYFDVSQGSYIQAIMPATSSSNSPVISNVAGNDYVLTGGSSIISFDASNSVSYALVGLEGVGGYYKIKNSSLTYNSNNSYVLVLSISQTIILQNMVFLIAYIDVNGRVSNYYRLSASQWTCGTGLLQVNCQWDRYNDVDLHVIEPSGEEIYFANSYSSNGGELDVDAHAACTNDSKEAENITYSQKGAFVQKGQYIVKANLWSSCNETKPTTVTTRAWYNGIALKDPNGKDFFSHTFYPSDANQQGASAGSTIMYVNIASDKYVQRNSKYLQQNDSAVSQITIPESIIKPQKVVVFQYNNSAKKKVKNISPTKGL